MATIAFILALAAGPRDPAAIIVEPQPVLTNHSTPRSLVKVIVHDAQGAPIPWQHVEFTSADSEQVHFPHPDAYTNANGEAYNYMVRIPDNPVGVETEFTVIADTLQGGPYRVTGLGLIIDGSPYGFSAPLLEPFHGAMQILNGATGGFVPMEIGTPVKAWSINPAVAEPLTGRITTEGPGEQNLELPVLARRGGETIFIIDTIDVAIYFADVTGDPAPAFLRGDVNGDAALDVSDPVATLAALFLGSAQPACLEAADADDSGQLDVTDPVYSLGFLFLGGPAPPAPYPERGQDPTPDLLGCLSPLPVR